ncbi:epoxide hydrolase 1 [Bombina bombina]|uniref:epoxide hydrolase 1 n=1 Tax=Bombina bombina TaxID=8345 RepID=UPI00235A7269|nr:epoxide hydrolase 1 [Bombina bombina]XP_053568688.1 epoxide hydrolase 1 [Bombina bombina]
MWRQLLDNGRSAFNDHWPQSLLVPAAVGVGSILVCWKLCGSKRKTIEIGDGWWGPGERPSLQSEDTSVRPFRIAVSDAEIKDLHERLDWTRFSSPLEDSQFHYGFNSTHLKKVLSYWRNDFDIHKQIDHLNIYPHYKTTIEGLEVHFIHVKPPQLAPGKKARPLLMVHGWPGSFYEFYRIIPLLTEPEKHGLNPDLSFEVICPSIPGFGFSEASHKKGFNTVAAARIFYKLMLRLGFKEFYLQGGDWGSAIATNLSQMKPEAVKGLHLNVVFLENGSLGMFISVLLGRYVPWLVGLTREDVRRLFPYLEKNLYAILRESGYFHLQATKPDTVGSALNDSPAGLAAYILEKFSTWTDSSFRELEDGGLERKYTMDHLLTNVLIYWLTGSITSSMRFYKENIVRGMGDTPQVKTGVYVPTGIAAFPCDIKHVPQSWIKMKYKNIVTYTFMPSGGHFASFEEPGLLAKDIQHFVSRVEKK